MSNPSIQLNQIPNEVELADLLQLLKKDIFLSMNCHHLATVQSFDSTKQTVQATINYKKTFFQLDTKTQIYNPVLKDYPQIIDCPAIFLGGGTAFLTFPIQPGDQCLILFNDRDMDNWFAGSTTSANASNRLHSFSDGIALIGLRSLAHLISNFDTNRAVLRNGSPAVGVRSSNGKVLVTNNYPTNSTTLNTVLQTLITDLNTLIGQISLITVVCATPGSPSSVPVNAAAITAVTSSLNTLSTTIGGLLE